MKSRAASLRAPRDRLADQYGEARRKHRKRAGICRRLRDITTALLRAELREAKAKSDAKPDASPDLFTF